MAIRTLPKLHLLDTPHQAKNHPDASQTGRLHPLGVATTQFKVLMEYPNRNQKIPSASKYPWKTQAIIPRLVLLFLSIQKTSPCSEQVMPIRILFWLISCNIYQRPPNQTASNESTTVKAIVSLKGHIEAINLANSNQSSVERKPYIQTAICPRIRSNRASNQPQKPTSRINHSKWERSLQLKIRLLPISNKLQTKEVSQGRLYSVRTTYKYLKLPSLPHSPTIFGWARSTWITPQHLRICGTLPTSPLQLCSSFRSRCWKLSQHRETITLRLDSHTLCQMSRWKELQHLDVPTQLQLSIGKLELLRSQAALYTSTL